MRASRLPFGEYFFVSTLAVLAVAPISARGELAPREPPLIEVQASQIDAMSVLVELAEIRNINWIGVHPSVSNRVNIPRQEIALDTLRRQLVDQLQSNIVVVDDIEIASMCRQLDVSQLPQTQAPPITLHFSKISAAELFALLAHNLDRKLKYPQGTPDIHLAINTQNQSPTKILAIVSTALGAAVRIDAESLEIRKAARQSNCVGKAAWTAAKVEQGQLVGEVEARHRLVRVECARSRNIPESREYPCEPLESFELEQLAVRGYIVLAPLSPILALLETPRGELLRIYRGARLGARFGVVTGVNRDAVLVNEYGYKNGALVVERLLQVSTATGHIDADTAIPGRSMPLRLPLSRSVTERYALEDLLLESTEQVNGRWSAYLRDVHGGRYRVILGLYAGVNDGKIVRINNDSIHIVEIVSDNLGGYMQQEVVLQRGVWYEDPRTVLKRKYTVPELDTDLQAAFVYAASRGDVLELERLLEQGANLDAALSGDLGNALLAAVRLQRPKAINWLLANGAQPNCFIGTREHTPLIEAVRRENEEAINVLLDAGADINLADAKGWSPLHHATSEGGSGILTIVELLLKRGADPRIHNSIGFTPFNFAAISGRLDFLKLFLNAGVGIESRDRNGHTMLAAASASRHIDIVKFLLDAGANVNATNRFDETVLDLARQRGASLELVRLLEENGARAGN